MQCLCKAILVPKPIDFYFIIFFFWGQKSDTRYYNNYIVKLVYGYTILEGVIVVHNAILSLSVQYWGSSFCQMRK